jgi:hypothetical protein
MGNMWRMDLGHYDVIMIFGVAPLMARLADK